MAGLWEGLALLSAHSHSGIQCLRPLPSWQWCILSRCLFPLTLLLCHSLFHAAPPLSQIRSSSTAAALGHERLWPASHDGLRPPSPSRNMHDYALRRHGQVGGPSLPPFSNVLVAVLIKHKAPHSMNILFLSGCWTKIPPQGTLFTGLRPAVQACLHTSVSAYPTCFLVAAPIVSCAPCVQGSAAAGLGQPQSPVSTARQLEPSFLAIQAGCVAKARALILAYGDQSRVWA